MLTSPHTARPESQRAVCKATIDRQQTQRRRHPRGTSPRMLFAMDRRIAALDMRRRGATYREIAAALGLANPGTAHRMVSEELAAMREQCAESAQELVELELERLDLLWRSLMPAVQSGNPRAIMTCLAVSKQRCALLGLDKPQPRQHERPVKTYVVLDASPDCPAWPDKTPQPQPFFDGLRSNRL